ncbi:DUF3127 domain-containing protein [Parapedobacter sp. 10938]|uniref:DUF3127 domain-containing protein n=1 Tax=Parapedobacter flavus TaxID=3110225 RepID=UPI002DB5EB52|nr:DUF3127 domain-containing protein [Parapedobacter sp. 10938]MEC3879475.1 DUF3127 domain-containing protein [Parapedobacter sp. 10938]
MEIRGKVHEIGDVQQVTDTFKKRDLIVQYAENPQFVEYIRFEATQDRTSLFDSLNVGDEVEVSFNLRGRPWTNKDGVTSYFNSLVAWRVAKVTAEPVQAGQPSGAPQQAATPPTVDISADDGKDDDLPF